MEEKNKKDVEEIMEEVDKYIEDIHIFYETLNLYRDVYTYIKFNKYEQVSEYVAQLQNYLDFELVDDFTEILDEVYTLLQSENKEEFIKNFKDYIDALATLAEKAKEGKYEEDE